MITYYGDAREKALEEWVRRLRTDTWLVNANRLAGRVFTAHYATLSNTKDKPTHPVLTLRLIGGIGDASIDNLDDTVLLVEAWSKKGSTELSTIYSSHDPTLGPVGVRAVLHNKTFVLTEVIVELCRQTSLVEHLYDQTLGTHKSVARYQVKLAARTVQI